MPPATIVAVAPQNVAWNSQNACKGSPSTGDSASIKNQPSVPNKAPALPYMSAKPNMK